MKPTAPRSTAITTIASHAASDSTLGTGELARAFDRAHHGTGRTERLPADASLDSSSNAPEPVVPE